MKLLIDKGANLATLINVADVVQGRQDELIAYYQHIADTIMAKAAGCIGNALHRSLDGTRVVNYAQWESEAALRAAQQSPEMQRLIREKRDFFRSDPKFFEIVSLSGPNA